MSKEMKRTRDAFTFSLGGMSIMSPFFAVPVIADDRFNRMLEERRSQARQNGEPGSVAEVPQLAEC